jgi:REP element-mobilizing transposase RayT
LFRTASDAGIFLALLAEVDQRYYQEIHSYCLMKNHYHLLTRSAAGRLSDAMRFLNSRFGQTLNELLGLKGSRFDGRYYAKMIDDDGQLLTTSRYIHRNPVDAGIVDSPSSYRWSSQQAYEGFTSTAWLHTESVRSVAGGPDAYVRFVLQSAPTDKRSVLSTGSDPS